MSVELTISGMSCGHCVATVRSALAAVPGVTVKDVKVGSATVDTDGTPASIEAIKAAVDDAGFVVVQSG